MIREIEDVVFGMSEMKDGNMDERFGGKKEVWANRRNFFEDNGAERKKAIFMKNNHGAEIVVVRSKDKGGLIECDVLFTKDKNLPLAFTPADCMPIYLWNREYVGLVHAGRNGTIEKILLKAVMKMFELSPNFPINIYFGDSIESCCYYFDHDFFRNEAGKMFPGIYMVGEARKARVDLYAANINQIISFCSFDCFGTILIHGSGRERLCTCCAKENKRDYKYFSHVRSSHGARFECQDGRNLAFIMKK